MKYDDRDDNMSDEEVKRLKKIRAELNKLRKSQQPMTKEALVAFEAYQIVDSHIPKTRDT